jgi:hypothetical protein
MSEVPSCVVDPKTASPLFGAVECDVYRINIGKVSFVFCIDAKTAIVFRAVPRDEQPRNMNEVRVQNVCTAADACGVLLKDRVRDSDVRIPAVKTTAFVAVAFGEAAVCNCYIVPILLNVVVDRPISEIDICFWAATRVDDRSGEK